MAVTRAIELRTAIPGPKSKAILERKERVVADPLSVFVPVVIDHSQGTTLTDVAFADSDHGWAVGGDVILTTSDDDRDVRNAYQAQANCYVTKPVDTDQLLSLIRVWLYE